MLTAPVLWFAGGMIMFGLEALAPVGVFLFFGLGCLAGWIAALLDCPLTWQILAATAVCLLSLAVLRKKLGSIFSGMSRQEQQNSSPLEGQDGVVSTAIRPGHEGQVCVLGSYWRAVAEEALEEGENIVVAAADQEDALLLHVRRS